jgi:hypothetical protein
MGKVTERIFSEHKDSMSVPVNIATDIWPMFSYLRIYS